MAKIIGNTTATPNPRPDWNQVDETKADYIKNKPTILTEDDVVELISANNTGGNGGGDNGATYIPSVSEDGVISWTNDKGLENPAPVNIKGENGSDGDTPYIKNNNWWIGDTDTGVKAQGIDGQDGASGVDGTDGQTPYIKNGTWWLGETDTSVKAEGKDGSNGTNGIDGKSAYDTAKEGGYTGTETQFANKLAETPYKISVKEYGAKGDGSTNDTKAFQNALANNRVVYVPGGTYKLNDTLIIRENCELELAQDAVLRFTQKDKNCITLLRLSHLKGNHATIFVPYDFGTDASGNKIGTPYTFKTGAKSGDDFLSTVSVINMSNADDIANIPDAYNTTAFKNKDWANLYTPDGVIDENDNILAVPPFTKWDPSWKTGRYLTDINICKPDNRGFHYSYGAGDAGYTYATYGKAMNIECSREDNDLVSFMWGVTMSGVRIAGAFDIGIHIHNEEVVNSEGKDISAWNHEMRIEAVMDGPERAVVLEKCNNAFLDITHQPRLALSSDGTTETKYAKQGIVLRRCNNINLTRAYVWDWDVHRVIDYGTEAGLENKYLVLYGSCSGIVMSDPHYKYPGATEVRDNFYIDPSINPEKITILQEPITRWFKPIDGEPYFFDGDVNKPLLLEEEFNNCFVTDNVADFTDALASATDIDGTIYNSIGYNPDVRLVLGTGAESGSGGYHVSTGFIQYESGLTINMENINFSRDDGQTGVIFYDSNYTRIGSISRSSFDTGSWYLKEYTETEQGCSITFHRLAEMSSNTPYYIRFVFHTTCFGNNPIIAVGKEISYSQKGFLADSIKVNDDNIESTKLNALQTRVNNIEQNVTDSINELEAEVDALETEVDEKLKNVSITTKQVDFILPAVGEDVLVPDYTNVKAPYQDGVWNNDGTISAVNTSIYIEPREFQVGDVVRICGVDFSSTWPGKPRLYRFNKSTGAYVDADNLGTKVPSAASGSLYLSVGTYDWDVSTLTLTITFTGNVRDYTYGFGGGYATGYDANSVIMTVNEEIKDKAVWQGEPLRFDDTLYAQNVVLTSPNGNTFKLTVSDDGVLTATAFTG